MRYNITQYGDEGQLSPEQKLAAEILSKPGRGGMKLEQIAEHIGISARTLNRWRQDPAFLEYVKQRTMQNVMEDLPDVLESLTIKAKRGDSVKAQEVWLKAMGVMNQEFTVRPAPAKEDRSDAAIIADIEHLRIQLGEI